jgi:hypothetical protein
MGIYAIERHKLAEVVCRDWMGIVAEEIARVVTAAANGSRGDKRSNACKGRGESWTSFQFFRRRRNYIGMQSHEGGSFCRGVPCMRLRNGHALARTLANVHSAQN